MKKQKTKKQKTKKQKIIYSFINHFPGGWGGGEPACYFVVDPSLAEIQYGVYRPVGGERIVVFAGPSCSVSVYSTERHPQGPRLSESDAVAWLVDK